MSGDSGTPDPPSIPGVGTQLPGVSWSGHALTPAPWGPRDLAGALGIALGLFLVLVLTAGLIGVLSGIGHHPGRELALGLAATFGFDLCLMGIALVIALGRYGLDLSSFGYRSFPPNEALLAISVILGTFALLAVYVTITKALHLDRLVPEPNLPKGAFDYKVLTIVTGIEACLIAPLVEESFFRGFLFRGLLDHSLSLRLPRLRLGHQMGFWTAALLSGLVFAVLHGQLGLLLPFTAVGVLFAWLFWRSGSLWPNILAHAGFNTISFVASLVAHHSL
jgi:membrane protease YdiL (CAAX protease family)